jgi:hypothetical protein
MQAHERADMNEKSVQESGLFGHFSKSDVRYWQGAIFHQSYTRAGKTLLTKDWAMKIAREGRRQTFPLLRTSTNHRAGEGYATADRQNVSDTFGLSSGPHKYDYRGGGHAKWRTEVHGIKKR